MSRPVPKRVGAEERSGIKVGHVYETRIGPVQVKSIWKPPRSGWMARVAAADGHQEGLEIRELASKKRKYVYGCYTEGPGRVRRRKVNPRRQGVILYAQRKGGPVLKYLAGGTKFGRRGTPLRFRSAAEAKLAAWALKDMFPVLQPYRLFYE